MKNGSALARMRQLVLEACAGNLKSAQLASKGFSAPDIRVIVFSAMILAADMVRFLAVAANERHIP